MLGPVDTESRDEAAAQNLFLALGQNSMKEIILSSLPLREGLVSQKCPADRMKITKLADRYLSRCGVETLN